MAAVLNEYFSLVAVCFYKRDATGTLVHYFTIELEDAQITPITIDGHSAGGADSHRPLHLESVEFRAHRIYFIDEVGGSSTYVEPRPPLNR